jgi:hypothetical protein
MAMTSPNALGRNGDCTTVTFKAIRLIAGIAVSNLKMSWLICLDNLMALN